MRDEPSLIHILCFIAGRGSVVMDLRKTAVRYMRPGVTWFVIDFMSTFPYGKVAATRSRGYSLLRLLRITRLVRVFRAGGNAREILDRLIARFQIRAAHIDIIRFMVGIGLVRLQMIVAGVQWLRTDNRNGP